MNIIYNLSTGPRKMNLNTLVNIAGVHFELFYAISKFKVKKKKKKPLYDM